nr:hypothetical protein GCM10020093_082240 [Planobispora longispora]
MDAATGAVDPGFTIRPGSPRGSRVRVYALALGRDRLAVDGNFTTLDGHSRPQLGLVDIGASRAKVSSWRTDAYAAACMPAFPSYVRGSTSPPTGAISWSSPAAGPAGRGGCATAPRASRPTPAARPGPPG